MDTNTVAIIVVALLVIFATGGTDCFSQTCQCEDQLLAMAYCVVGL